LIETSTAPAPTKGRFSPQQISRRRWLFIVFAALLLSAELDLAAGGSAFAFHGGGPSALYAVALFIERGLSVVVAIGGMALLVVSGRHRSHGALIGPKDRALRAAPQRESLDAPPESRVTRGLDFAPRRQGED